MKKVFAIVALLIAVGGGFGYTKLNSKPVEHAKPKVEGTVYVLRKDFLVNLRDGRFGRVSAALVLGPEKGDAKEEHEMPVTPPEGYGGLPQEAVVRDIVTDALTGLSAKALLSRTKRHRLEKRIAKRLERRTDVSVTSFVLTDFTVQ